MPSAALLGQSLLAGIFAGAFYGLLGLGLTLSWGMLRQINLAHFALVFLGGYLTYQLSAAGFDPLLTLALIAPAFFVLGVALHALLARFKAPGFAEIPDPAAVAHSGRPGRGLVRTRNKVVKTDGTVVLTYTPLRMVKCKSAAN